MSSQHQACYQLLAGQCCAGERLHDSKRVLAKILSPAVIPRPSHHNSFDLHSLPVFYLQIFNIASSSVPKVHGAASQLFCCSCEDLLVHKESPGIS